MPMPVSRTSKLSSARPFCSASGKTSTTTSPLCVNLIGVADEVRQHLAQALWIAEHAVRHARVHVHDQLEVLRGGLHGHRHADVLDAVAHVHRHALDLELAGFDLRVIENVVDDAEQDSSRWCGCVSANSRCADCSGVSSSSSVMPITPFIGVRIS